MNGGANSPDDQWAQGRQTGWAELLGMFGPVSGSRTDAELMELQDEPPWRSVAAGDAAALMAAYRRGRALAAELRRGLIGAGLDAEEVPAVHGSVDATGQPVVVVGEMTARTAEHLVLILRRRPNPPATGEGTVKAA